VKLLALIGFCTVVFWLTSVKIVAVFTLFTVAFYKVARLQFYHAFQGLKPALWILAIIFSVQVFFSGWSLALFILLRFTCLILAANLLTMTTRSSEFVDGIKSLLRHAPRWIPAEKIALAISLTLRFIPLVRSVFEEVRTAQRARGLDLNLTALLNPLTIRTLKIGDQITDAIRARSPEL
jgi:biotin transport system permease protein